MAESSTTIAVMWEEVPPIDQNGVITMYEVMYTPLETFGGTLQSNTTTVSEPEEYVNYTISVRAYTSVGMGPYSEDVTILTEEESTSFNNTILSLWQA